MYTYLVTSIILPITCIHLSAHLILVTYICPIRLPTQYETALFVISAVLSFSIDVYVHISMNPGSVPAEILKDI